MVGVASCWNCPAKAAEQVFLSSIDYMTADYQTYAITRRDGIWECPDIDATAATWPELKAKIDAKIAMLPVWSVARKQIIDYGR